MNSSDFRGGTVNVVSGFFEFLVPGLSGRDQEG